MSDFRLDPSEVISTGSVQHSGHRKKMRYSRATMLSSAEWTLRHTPTGIEAQGALPPGHYTRKELRLLQQQLYNDLYAALEQAVAKALRTPRR